MIEENNEEQVQVNFFFAKADFTVIMSTSSAEINVKLNHSGAGGSHEKCFKRKSVN